MSLVSENRSLCHQGLKRCGMCLEIKSKNFYSSKGAKRGFAVSSRCKECDKIYRAEYKKSFPNYCKKLLAQIRFRAKQSEIPFDLEVEDLLNLWTGKCYFTNKTITHLEPTKGGKSAGDLQASIDKLDPGKGYVKENVQWVAQKVNLIKNNLTEKEFYDFCENILRIKDERDKEIL